jgi:Carboxypeptidase regulatory-like domain
MRNLVTRSAILKISLAALLALSATFSGAQDKASITGTVTDTSGAVIAGASVILSNLAKGSTFKAVTNGLGAYTFANVDPGPGYRLKVTASGFKSTDISGIYLNVTSTQTVNVKLQVGAAAETVQVSAASENVTLNTTDATIGNNFEVQMVNDLPVQNRDSPSALFYQQPGVTSDGAVTGARTDQTHVTVDGLDVDDRGTGQFGAVSANAPVDSVQEFRGVTAGQTASFDTGGGGQFQLVTKSGTNSFHGALFEYHRDTDTEANYWFNNNAGYPRPPLIRNQFGGNIGGPIKHDKAFFFFEYNGRRDDLADPVEHSVPTASYLAGNISYINDTAGCNSSSRLNTTPGCISTKSAATIRNNSDPNTVYDPLGIGQNAALASFVSSRYVYTKGLDPTGGDGINTEGLRFNAPENLKENDYVSRVDYNLTDNQKLWARGSVQSQREGDDINYSGPIQFPGDPITRSIDISSYGWIVGDTWTIGATKSNQASYGMTIDRLNFPSLYNPTGAIYWYGFGPLSNPYLGNYNSQARKDPVPQFRDDFSWLKGTHSFQFGGTFKYITPFDNFVLNDYVTSLGIGGNLSQLDPTQRPSDVNSSSTATSNWDSALSFDLGRFAAIDGTFNYSADGTTATMGEGANRKYRDYETELYFSDTWKLTQSLTLTYGVRYQLFSVPYEMNGIESVEVDANTGKPLSFDDYFFKDRVPQSQATEIGPTSIPNIKYVLGGKANKNSVGGYYKPSYKDFAPRVAFAWNPTSDPKSVFSGSAGIVFDHTVVNAIQYFQDHSSYLFQADNNTLFGNAKNPEASLANDPRFTSITAIPTPPAAPAFSAATSPYVTNGVPNGAALNTFSTAIDPNLKTPYSIMIDFGFQRELGAGLLLKLNYAGRLGRRLLAQVDASQIIDTPDPTSEQLYSQAFADVTQKLRAGQDPLTLSSEPWFRNQIYPNFGPDGLGQYYGFDNSTQLLAYYEENLFLNGDIADLTQALTGPFAGVPIIGINEVIPSQFSSNDYYTNKGFSSYHGLLATLHKNTSYGLQFDLNYTWSHSIDNFSLVANGQSNYVGEFICDALQPRECRGNSDFDVTQVINGNFIYTLPFGRGKTYGAGMPLWLDEIAGGWLISGLPTWHTGTPYYANTSAYGAGYATLAPAILVGSAGAVKSHVHKDAASGNVYGYADVDAAYNAFEGPIGLHLGQRNELRGPHYANVDLGLRKTFPLAGDRYRLLFNVDAFNAFNHANFDTPNATLVSNSFGQISDTIGSPRVLQGALRLEF